MKNFLPPLLLTVSVLFANTARAEREQRVSVPSPDGKWSWEAESVTLANGNWWGYSTWLQNKVTGKTYCKVSDKNESSGPKRVGAMWSDDGKYVAAHFYYGRALIGTAVWHTGGKEPQWVRLPDFESDDDLRKILKPADRRLYEGWNRLWLVANEWQNHTDLKLTMSGKIYLKKRDGENKERIVDFDYSYVVRLDGDKALILSRDKMPVDY